MVLDFEPRSVSFVSLYEAEVHSEHHKGTSSPTHTAGQKMIISLDNYFLLFGDRGKMSVVSGWFSMNN